MKTCRLSLCFSIISFLMLSAFFAIPATAADPPGVKELSEHLQRLRETIEQDGLSFTVGDNPALHYSREELCGLKEPPGWREKGPFRRLAVSSELPAAFDWRDSGIIPPVRDQQSCGSCWAFGSVGPLEASIKWKDGLFFDLSEQWLVSCNTSGWSCSGGWWAHDYHINPGAVPESEFPYVGQDVACGGPYTHPYKIQSWSYIAGEESIPSADQIKQAIYSYGPVSVAVYVGDYFQAYTEGIFDKNEVGQVNHAVVLVGWDDNNGQGYWILRNSWGPGWGEDGYMRIRYGISQVGYSANYIVYAASVPPEIEVNPVSFAVDAPPGGQIARSLTISNTGEGPLEFSLSWKSLEGRGCSGGPDAYGYSWRDSNEPGGPEFDWVEISSVGMPLYLGDEDYGLAFLPFAFNFYGQDYNLVWISSNGFLTFDDVLSNYYDNEPIPSAADPNNLLAPFWDDLDPGIYGGGEVYYYYDQSQNRFIVEYQGVFHYSFFLPGAPETFEVILYPDGRIVYQYLKVSDPQFDLSGCTVGIENADGSIGLEAAYNTNYPASNLAIEFSRTTPWISFSPGQGSVSAHNSLAVQVTFNAAELTPGIYRGEIILTSNDQDEGQLTLPVTMTVGSGLYRVDSGDYDGDGQDDLALYRPANSSWLIRGQGTIYFGNPGDIPVPADYTGDGATDIAVFRPQNALWSVRNGPRYYLGRSGDLPIPGDYNGDGTAKPSIFRPSTNLWVLEPSNKTYFGRSDDQVVPADFNGDGRKEAAVFRSSSGLWITSGRSRWYFGGSEDTPVVNDYDGDGRQESAVFRSAKALWSVRKLSRFYFGQSGDSPVPADFDKNGRAEAAVFRADGALWMARGVTRCSFGSAGDLPVTK